LGESSADRFTSSVAAAMVEIAELKFVVAFREIEIDPDAW
jgi:hypothetical protein